MSGLGLFGIFRAKKGLCRDLKELFGRWAFTVFIFCWLQSLGFLGRFWFIVFRVEGFARLAEGCFLGVWDLGLLFFWAFRVFGLDLRLFGLGL